MKNETIKAVPIPGGEIALLLVAGLGLFAVIFSAFYWPASVLVDVTNHPLGRDFINVWAGPKVAFLDGAKELFDLRAYHQAIGKFYGTPLPFHNWGYPLFVLPVYWLFSQIPYLLSLAVWTFLFFATFAWAATRDVEPSKRMMTILLLALAPASLINIVGGQNGFITATLLLGGVLLIDRRPIVSGILIGFLVYKPHLGICLPFVLIALGAWRTIVAAAVTAVLVVASSFLLFSMSDWVDYFHVAGAFQTLLLSRFEGFYPNMMVSFVSGLRSLGIGYDTAIVLQAGLSLGVLAATVYGVKRTSDPCIRAFVVSTASLLITPYAFNYDMTAISAAMVWLFVGRLSIEREWRPVIWLAWLMPLLVMVPNIRMLGLAPVAIFGLFLLSLRLTSRLGERKDVELGLAPSTSNAA